MKKKVSFEAQLQELEILVETMDQPDLPLEEAINCYQKGIKLSQSLNATLEDAQQKVEYLSKQASRKNTEGTTE
jgi:exodeoxyribonuclease VII small subunit